MPQNRPAASGSGVTSTTNSNTMTGRVGTDGRPCIPPAASGTTGGSTGTVTNNPTAGTNQTSGSGSVSGGRPPGC